MHLFFIFVIEAGATLNREVEEIVLFDLKYPVIQILFLWYNIHCSFGNKFIIAYPFSMTLNIYNFECLHL